MQEGWRECWAKMSGQVSSPPERQTRWGKETFREIGCPVHREAHRGHPLSRCGSLHSPLSSFFCVGHLVLRTGCPGRFRYWGAAWLPGPYRVQLLFSWGPLPVLSVSHCWLPDSQHEKGSSGLPGGSVARTRWCVFQCTRARGQCSG